MASMSVGDRHSLEGALAALPDVSNNIIKSSDHYCNAGGFSDVYRREYRDNSGTGPTEVAVKSFRFLFTVNESETEKTDGKGVRKMIRRELGIWRRLKHPNIVPFLGIAYGFGRPEHASLVSSWMPNGSLQSFLEKHDGQLTIGHRLQLLSDVASGLSYLHSLSIIHGDLSCNNVLLDHDYTACLTDFGYSSMVGNLPEASRYLQMTTMKPGTLRWAAPEHFVANTEQAIKHTTQSDIYSFGNLGLLILSGKHPWSEIQRDAAVMLELSQGKKPKRPLSPPIEDHYWELIEQCWSPVGARPCAEDVVSCLEQFLHLLPPFIPLVDAFPALSHPEEGIDSPQSPISSISFFPEEQDVGVQEPDPLQYEDIRHLEPPIKSSSSVPTMRDSDGSDQLSMSFANSTRTVTLPRRTSLGGYVDIHPVQHSIDLSLADDRPGFFSKLRDSVGSLWSEISFPTRRSQMIDGSYYHESSSWSGISFPSRMRRVLHKRDRRNIG